MLRKLILTVSTATLLFANSLGNFNLPSVNSSNVTIEVTSKGFNFNQYPGKKVYLNFFGTHCPPCRAEIPRLMNDAMAEGAQVISIQAQSNDVSDSEVRGFISELGISYPVINGSSAVDLISFLSANNKWPGAVPYTLIFDENGNLVGSR